MIVSSEPVNTGGVSAANYNKRRRALRARIACIRCQRRKIKCDGLVPSCGSCFKAGVDCEDGSSEVNENSPRAQLLKLQQRVKDLESIISARCPDVDLSDGTFHNAGDRDLPEPESAASNTAHDVLLQRHGDQPVTAEASGVVSDQPEVSDGIAHEIGLVALQAGTDPRYIGPSSGYFFSRLLLSSASRSSRRRRSGNVDGATSTKLSTFALSQNFRSIPITPLPADKAYTIQLSEAYFQSIHFQYPFLHRPTHLKLIDKVYEIETPTANDAFQVTMVLAISATSMSRQHKVPLSGDGLCANAMQHFDKIYFENSVRSLQSLLLLLIYTLHSSSTGLNVWYLNYQCIAALLDLGLQRNVRAGRGISILEQEMRTRTFWTIYCLDRSVATIMGRPIGLRDEACDLRLPLDIDDEGLTAKVVTSRKSTDPPTHMSCAIHLFNLAHINSEIKYILHSVSHAKTLHAYPHIYDIHAWKTDILTKLSTWKATIPQYTGDRAYMTRLCTIKYHSLMMVLLRPTPRIPHPSAEDSKLCFESAVACIREYASLYADDLLVYSWIAFHTIFLSTLTMLHCIWNVSTIANTIESQYLQKDLRTVSNILSALGEYWPEAKRSRDALDGIGMTTLRWLNDNNNHATHTKSVSLYTAPTNSYSNQPDISTTAEAETAIQMDFNANDFYSSFFDDFNFNMDAQQQQFDLSSPGTVNALMQGCFTDQALFEVDGSLI